ncbi:MAG: tyrosine-type recombinase/integrase, partial [Microthrixaceae bacterium]
MQDLAESWHLVAFASDIQVSPATIAVYQRDLSAFVEWAARDDRLRPRDVDRKVLRRYLASLNTRGLAQRTIARKASSLRRYFRWATTRGLVDSDPAAGLSAPRGSARLPRILTVDELSQLLDEPPKRAAPDPLADLRDDVILELLYGSGLRVSEVCGLDVGSVDLDRRRLNVWGKGDKQRVVPVGEPGAEALESWLRHGRFEFIEQVTRRSRVTVEDSGNTRPGRIGRQGPDDEDGSALFFNSRGRRIGPR